MEKTLMTKELEESVRNLYRTKQECEVPTMFTEDHVGKEFTVKIKITDPAIAEYVLAGLMFNKINIGNIGMDIVEIRPKGLTDVDKEELITQMTEIIRRY